MGWDEGGWASGPQQGPPWSSRFSAGVAAAPLPVCHGVPMRVLGPMRHATLSRAECCCQAHPNRLFVHSAQKHTKHVYTYFTLCGGQGLLTHHTGEETMSQPGNQIPTQCYKALVLHRG